MWRIFPEKFLVVLTSFIGITLLSFTLIRMAPGDPVLLVAGERSIDNERYQTIERQYGFDRSLPVQYGIYLKRLLKGDFGTSAVSREPVLREFFRLFPATLELAFCAMLFALCLGLPIGILAAMKRNSLFDTTAMSVALVGYSMPIFWWGMLLVLFFSLLLGWTPVAGRLDFIYDIPPRTGFMLIDTLISGKPYALAAFINALHHLLLPAIVLGTVPLAIIARMTRSSMLTVLKSDYIRTARAKGVSSRRLIWIHALRNALIPILTVAGLQVSLLVTGAILTETIFAWPGIGKWMLDAISRRDYSVVQGGFVLIASSVVLVNLAIDLLYAWVNPRIRRGR